MRRLLIVVLLTLLLSVGLVALIEHDPGYVLITYGYYSLETSLWVGLLLLLATFLLFHYGLRAWKRLLASRGWVGSWFQVRNSKRSQLRTAAGLASYVEGNWSRSRRQLLAGARGSDTPTFNFLMAARASEKLGESEQSQQQLVMAETSDDAVNAAVVITRAELQIEKGQFKQALATLLGIRENAKRHPHALYLLSQVYIKLEEWDSLAELMPDLRKHKVLGDSRLDLLQQAIHKNLLSSAAVSGEEGERREKLQKAWKSLPANMKLDKQILAEYLTYLLAAGGSDEVAKMLERELKKNRDDKLIRLYGLTQGSDASKQLTIAEAWLREDPNNGELLLCAGRLALRNELWGKAKDYFQNSFKVRQSAETCAELGRLLAHLGETQQSNQYYQRGLLLSERNLPELPLPQRSTLG